jgi:hypothetical protein
LPVDKPKPITNNNSNNGNIPPISVAIKATSKWGNGANYQLYFTNKGNTAVCSVIFQLTPAFGVLF